MMLRHDCHYWHNLSSYGLACPAGHRYRPSAQMLPWPRTLSRAVRLGRGFVDPSDKARAWLDSRARRWRACWPVDRHRRPLRTVRGIARKCLGIVLSAIDIW